MGVPDAEQLSVLYSDAEMVGPCSSVGLEIGEARVLPLEQTWHGLERKEVLGDSCPSDFRLLSEGETE